jgi:hypothetical protein
MRALYSVCTRRRYVDTALAIRSPEEARHPEGEDGGPVGLGDLEVLDLCLGECGAAGEDDPLAGGESPSAQVVGRAVGAVGDKLVPVTRRLGSSCVSRPSAAAPDGGSRPARWRRRLAARGGGQLRSRGSVAICAATPVALYARRLRLVHRHLLRPGSRDVARNRNRSYCELPSKPAGRRQRPMCADGEPKRLCRRIQQGGTCRLRGDRVERAPRRQ